MRHIFVIADLLDRVDDVVRELLRGIIRRRIECGLRPVVIDCHAAANVEQIDRHFHLMDFRINARGLFHRVLDALDVRKLRPDMKVQQLQHVDATGFFQAVDYFKQFRCRQAELCCFAARFLPATGALRIELHAHADDRHVPFGAFRHAEDMIEFAKFLDNDHDALS